MEKEENKNFLKYTLFIISFCFLQFGFIFSVFADTTLPYATDFHQVYLQSYSNGVATFSSTYYNGASGTKGAVYTKGTPTNLCGANLPGGGVLSGLPNPWTVNPSLTTMPNGNYIICFVNTSFDWNAYILFSVDNHVVSFDSMAGTCFDGIMNGDETGIDTGGTCTPAFILQSVCTDGIMNGDETGIDTGGRCKTHFIGFTPENNTVLPGPTVTFTLDLWVNSKDIDTYIGVNLTLHNIDQNVLILSSASPSDIYLLDEFRVESAGLYHFSKTETIGNGNYTIQAEIRRAYLGGFIINPFSDINQSEYKHFIVGEGTFIGSVQQSGYDALSGVAGGAIGPGGVATIANNCNPLSSAFDVQKCGIFLFVPGGKYFDKTIKDMKDGLLTRLPWGYFYRVYDIWNNPEKTSLPAMVFPVYMGPGNTSNPGIEEITIDPGDMIAGAGGLLNDIRDPHTHKNMKDVFGPMVQLTFGLAVVFTIIADLTGSHKHDSGGDTGNVKKKLS